MTAICFHISYAPLILMIWNFAIHLQPLKTILDCEDYENLEKDTKKYKQVGQNGNTCGAFSTSCYVYLLIVATFLVFPACTLLWLVID